MIILILKSNSNNNNNENNDNDNDNDINNMTCMIYYDIILRYIALLYDCDIL